MLPGAYIIHRASLTDLPFFDRHSRSQVQLSPDVREVDERTWLSSLLESPPDAVLSTQVFFIPGKKPGDDAATRRVADVCETFREAMVLACLEFRVTVIP